MLITALLPQPKASMADEAGDSKVGATPEFSTNSAIGRLRML
jgi:hypothetical protein